MERIELSSAMDRQGGLPCYQDKRNKLEACTFIKERTRFSDGTLGPYIYTDRVTHAQYLDFRNGTILPRLSNDGTPCVDAHIEKRIKRALKHLAKAYRVDRKRGYR